jgi:hypothetical protein
MAVAVFVFKTENCDPECVICPDTTAAMVHALDTAFGCRHDPDWRQDHSKTPAVIAAMRTFSAELRTGNPVWKWGWRRRGYGTLVRMLSPVGDPASLATWAATTALMVSRDTKMVQIDDVGGYY